MAVGGEASPASDPPSVAGVIELPDFKGGFSFFDVADCRVLSCLLFGTVNALLFARLDVEPLASLQADNVDTVEQITPVSVPRSLVLDPVLSYVDPVS